MSHIGQLSRSGSSLDLSGRISDESGSIDKSGRSRAQSLTTDVGRSRAQSLTTDLPRQVSGESNLQHNISDTVGGAEKWKNRNWRQEKAEMVVGATAAGVGFTRFLSGAAHVFKAGVHTAASLPII